MVAPCLRAVWSRPSLSANRLIGHYTVCINGEQMPGWDFAHAWNIWAFCACSKTPSLSAAQMHFLKLIEYRICLDYLDTLTRCRRKRLSHTIYWMSPISILGTSGYEVYIFLEKMAKVFANSGDPDQTPRSAASDLGLHCLPITLLRVSRLQWVNALLLASCPTIWTISFLSYNLNKFIWIPVDLKLLDE